MKGIVYKIFKLTFLIVLTLSASGVSAQQKAGRYVWVPDSMARAVDEVLTYGKSGLHVRPDTVDVKERVLFRGDTIPMVLHQRNFGRYDRGMHNFLFIPHGQWQFGLTASYGEFSSKDLELFDMVSDVNFNAHSFAVRPYVSYFIRSNMSLGIRLAYTGTKANVGSFRVDIMEDMNFNLKDIMYRDESYAAALVFSQYFGIARRGRFGVFNEVELNFASGNSDFRRPFNGEPKNTRTTYMKASLNFSPGVSVMIMRNVSFNVSFGVFGFYLRNEKQHITVTHTLEDPGDGTQRVQLEEIEGGNRFTSGANFRFNIFNINFGIGVHI